MELSKIPSYKLPISLQRSFKSNFLVIVLLFSNSSLINNDVKSDNKKESGPEKNSFFFKEKVIKILIWKKIEYRNIIQFYYLYVGNIFHTLTFCCIFDNHIIP